MAEIKPYTDLESTPFSMDDIQYISNLYYTENKSKSEISRITGLTYYMVNKIILSIEEGAFDDESDTEEYEDTTPFDLTDLGNDSVINIYDGVTIEIHNYYDDTPENNASSKKKKKKKKLNRKKLGDWAKRIKQRDKNTCCVCGKQQENMEAHHIKPKSLHPEEGLADLNGICMCHDCHQKYNNEYTPTKQNAVTLIKFISKKNKNKGGLKEI